MGDESELKSGTDSQNPELFPFFTYVWENIKTAHEWKENGLICVWLFSGIGSIIFKFLDFEDSWKEPLEKWSEITSVSFFTFWLFAWVPYRRHRMLEKQLIKLKESKDIPLIVAPTLQEIERYSSRTATIIKIGGPMMCLIIAFQVVFNAHNEVTYHIESHVYPEPPQNIGNNSQIINGNANIINEHGQPSVTNSNPEYSIEESRALRFAIWIDEPLELLEHTNFVNHIIGTNENLRMDLVNHIAKLNSLYGPPPIFPLYQTNYLEHGIEVVAESSNSIGNYNFLWSTNSIFGNIPSSSFQNDAGYHFNK